MGIRRHIRKQKKEVLSNLKKGVVPLGLSKNFLLKQMKYVLTEAEVNRLFDVLDEDFFEFVISKPIANEHKELSHYQVYIDNNDFKKELAWCSRFLIDYNEEIQDFLKLEKEYEKNLFLGHYHVALDILKKIDETVSVSAWSVQQRLFVAELQKGFKANKDVLSDIISDDNSILLNFFANYTSIRIEKNISPNQYTSFVDEYIKQLEVDQLKNYVYYKVDFFRKFKYATASSILVYDGTLSIIDRYKSFICCAQLALCDDDVPDTFQIQLKEIIRQLNKLINDIDLILLSSLDDGVIEDVDNDFLTLLDSYSVGNYDESLFYSKEYLLGKPTCFPALLIYVKSLAHLKKNHNSFCESESVLNKTINSVLSIVNLEKNVSENTYLDLYKIAHFFGYHSFSIGIFYFLNEQLPFTWPQAFEIDVHKFAALNSKATNPTLFNHVRTNKQKLFLDQFSKKKFSETINLISFFSNLANEINYEDYSFRYLKYVAYSLRSKGFYKRSLHIFDYILITSRFTEDLNIVFQKVEILIGKFSCLTNLKMDMEALDLVVSELIRNKELLNRFYNPIFIERLTSTEDEDIQASISLPIFLKFYEDYIDDYSIYVSYDNYLWSIGCETPKDFFKRFNSSDSKHIVFLEKVCKHEVLHSSPFFADQEELDLARIEICTYLSTSFKNSVALETEISELLRRVLIRKGIKQIDYSKIYVDVKGLKTNINKDLREGFNRNIEIASMPVDQLNKILDSIGNLLVYYLDEDSENHTEKDLGEKIKLTSYNRFLHFVETFFKIRDSFLMSSEYGLDTYLSMRIRHGTLPGQLRSVFESHRLITAKNESDQNYLDNEYWLAKFNTLQDEVKEKIKQALNEFSESIDFISDNLKSQVIQIRTEENSKKPKGLFNYTYSEGDLLELFASKFGSIKDFDQFVDEVINTLWQKTDENLNEIRAYLNGHFVDIVRKHFESLELKISQIELFAIYKPAAYHEFMATLNDCRTAIINEIQKISDWFRISNKKFIEDFDFSILLESSVSILNRSFRNATINITNEADLKLDGDLFPIFTDILFYLLHNSLKHSKLPLDKLIINILVTQNEQVVKIEIVNNVIDDILYLEELEQRIEKTKQILIGESTYERINEEGGTGFPKIKKALYHDLERKECVIDMQLQRVIDSEPSFKAYVQFEYFGLNKKDNDENIDN